MKSKMRTPRRSFVLPGFLIFVALVAAHQGWTYKPIHICGTSMEPTYHDGAYALARLRFSTDDLLPGTVILFRHDGEICVKRIESVENGKIFVLGDNREASDDSRDYGTIPASSVVGLLADQRPRRVAK